MKDRNGIEIEAGDTVEFYWYGKAKKQRGIIVSETILRIEGKTWTTAVDDFESERIIVIKKGMI